MKKQTKSMRVSTHAHIQTPSRLKHGNSVIASERSERGNPISSPSLAEGARGWVNPTLESQAKLATANKHSTSSLRDSSQKRGIVAIQNQTRLAQKIDCHEFDKSNSRNGGFVYCHANANAFARKTRRSRSFFSNDESFHAFDNAKLTHPQTPSAREGALRVPNKVILREGLSKVALQSNNANPAVCYTAKTPCHTTTSCHLKGEARSISKNISKDSIHCHTERSEVSKGISKNSALCHTERSEVSKKTK